VEDGSFGSQPVGIHQRRVRVIGTGFYARCFLAPLAAAASLGVLTTWQDVATTARELSFGDLALGGAVTLAMVVPFLRSLFLGVWLDEEQLVARTWFRTLKLRRSMLSGCDTVTYRGFCIQSRMSGGSIAFRCRPLKVQFMHSGEPLRSAAVPVCRRIKFAPTSRVLQRLRL